MHRVAHCRTPRVHFHTIRLASGEPFPLPAAYGPAQLPVWNLNDVFWGCRVFEGS